MGFSYNLIKCVHLRMFVKVAACKLMFLTATIHHTVQWVYADGQQVTRIDESKYGINGGARGELGALCTIRYH